MRGEPVSAVRRLDPRRDMGLIRERIDRLLDAGDDPASTMADLVGRDPIAFADLVVGPKALGHPRWVRTALVHADSLERSLAPSALYRRLVEIAPECGLDAMDEAIRRHPGADWLVPLARRVEGQRAGESHLVATSTHPSFAQNCWRHAAAGHLPGVLIAAHRTGRPEPAAALAANGHIDAAGRALVDTLTSAPDSPVVASIAAAWGPHPMAVLRAAIPHLRSTSVAWALHRHCVGYPEFARFLEGVIGAMVDT